MCLPRAYKYLTLVQFYFHMCNLFKDTNAFVSSFIVSPSLKQGQTTITALNNILIMGYNAVAADVLDLGTLGFFVSGNLFQELLRAQLLRTCQVLGVMVLVLQLEVMCIHLVGT